MLTLIPKEGVFSLATSNLYLNISKIFINDNPEFVSDNVGKIPFRAAVEEIIQTIGRNPKKIFREIQKRSLTPYESLGLKKETS